MSKRVSGISSGNRSTISSPPQLHSFYIPSLSMSIVSFSRSVLPHFFLLPPNPLPLSSNTPSPFFFHAPIYFSASNPHLGGFHVAQTRPPLPHIYTYCAAVFLLLFLLLFICSPLTLMPYPRNQICCFNFLPKTQLELSGNQLI